MPENLVERQGWKQVAESLRPVHGSFRRQAKAQALERSAGLLPEVVILEVAVVPLPECSRRI